MLQGLEYATSFQKLKQVLEFRLMANPTILFTLEPVTIQPKTGNYKSIKSPGTWRIMLGN